LAHRILLISYYWPPSGGGGVHRWLKFSKYLPEFDIEPVIYTPLDPDYPAIDESLLDEVDDKLQIWRHPIWEPYGYYRKFMGLKRDKKIYSGFITEDEHETFRQKVSVFVRGNFFIPDARKFWIKPSIKYLTKRLKAEPVDLIVSTGPPHSMHLIAAGVHKAFQIPWIADFRDPWTGIDFYDQLRLLPWSDRKHKRLEREVLTEADCVVTVSPQWKLDLEKISGRDVHVMTNGFDEADFKETPPLTDEFTLTHLGSINADRNANMLWDTLEAMLANDAEFARHFQLDLIGPIDQSVLVYLKRLPALSQRMQVTEWLDHSAAIRRIQASQVLLLLLNDTPNKFGIVPGKLFEYLGANRPVICIGPVRGDADHILQECQAGKVVDYRDQEGMEQVVRTYFNAYQSGAPVASPDAQIAQYARRNIVKTYAELMQRIIEDTPG
jgi:glycosyltransferase involved in cell wall biosynthesis